MTNIAHVHPGLKPPLSKSHIGTELSNFITPISTMKKVQTGQVLISVRYSIHHRPTDQNYCVLPG